MAGTASPPKENKPVDFSELSVVMPVKEISPDAFMAMLKSWGYDGK